MEKRYQISGQFPQEDWDRLSELHEYFKENSKGPKGRVSINDVLKLSVNHTFETFHIYEEMVEEVGHLKDENCKLENRVKELEEKRIEKTKEIKTAIVGLTN